MRGLLSRGFEFLIFSNTFIALCAAGQGLLTYQLLDRPPDPEVLVLLFFSTAFVYNAQTVLNKIPRGGTSVYYRVDWLIRHRRLMRGLSFLALAFMAGAALFLESHSLMALAATGLLAALYSFPVLKTGGLRQVPGIKLFLIAGVWASACVLIPYLESGLILDTGKVLILWLKRFLFVAAITLPFDTRDIESDRAAGLFTLATWLGARKATWLAVAFLGAYLLLLYWFQQPAPPRSFYALLLTALLSGILILLSARKRGAYFYLFFLDGMLLLQPLLVLLLAGTAAGRL